MAMNDRRMNLQRTESKEHDSKQIEIFKWNDRNGRSSSKLDLNTKHEGDKGAKSRSRTPNQSQLFQQEFLRIQSSIPNIDSKMFGAGIEKEKKASQERREQF